MTRHTRTLWIVVLALLTLALIGGPSYAQPAFQSTAQPNVPTATRIKGSPPPPLPPAAVGAPRSTIHVVQPDENLFRIAMRYGSTVEAIVRANGLRDAAQIQIGQRLLIPDVNPEVLANLPASPEAPAADAASAGQMQPGSPLAYYVQPGDSLINLSLRYSTDAATLARLNNILNPHQPLSAGMGLTVKEGTNGQPAVKNGRLHTVQPGENLFRIASRYGVPLHVIQYANHIDNPAAIFPGQPIAIPGPADGPTLIDAPEPFERMSMIPFQPEQGRTLSLQITTLAPVKLSGQFLGKPLSISSDAARTKHSIVVGVQALIKPGVYPLELTANGDQGQKYTLSRRILISDGRYASEQIKLPPDQLDLLDPKFTQPEIDKIQAIVTKYTDQQFVIGPMGLPCAAAVTSQYGTRRSYNSGPYDQFHTGTDFAALPGSAIYAPAGGVVVLAQSLNVRGNATIIDHGRGIFTGYWHQTELKVKVGDVVTQGQVIGTVGGTGRATGPHLHWELFINGVQVDPLQWTKQPLG